MVLSAPMQIFLLLLSLAFLGWVAYASVNVVFKDQIISAKEHHFAAMQAAYEGRLAEMQAAYDELNGALVLTEERFEHATQSLQQKHDQLSTIVARQASAMRNIKSLKVQIASAIKAQADQRDGTNLVIGSGESAIGGVTEGPGEAIDVEASEAEAALKEDAETNLGSAPSARKANTRVGAKKSQSEAEGGPEMPVLARLDDRTDTAPTFAVATADKSVSWNANVTASMPTPFAEETRRIDAKLTTLDAAQRQMVAALERQARIQSAEIQTVIEKTGINVDRILDTEVADASAGDDGKGGPLVPVVEPGAAVNPKAKKEMTIVDHLQVEVARLAAMESALSSLPLVNPVNAAYRITSGFGKRYDPFTKQRAYHFGLDIVAPLKTPVHVTAPGKVVVAGRTGPYGNMVEIDHGNGIRTRYGHLYSISVKPGQMVHLQDVIGLLGSSGRSTGAHLHYEVRFNGTLRDPARFLQAGRHIFQG